MADKATTSPDYTTWLGEVKSRIQAARISAARSVNRELIVLYNFSRRLRENWAEGREMLTWEIS